MCKNTFLCFYNSHYMEREKGLGGCPAVICDVLFHRFSIAARMDRDILMARSYEPFRTNGSHQANFVQLSHASELLAKWQVATCWPR